MILFLKIIFKDFYYLFKTKEARTFLFYVLKYSGRSRFVKTKIKVGKYALQVPDPLSFIWQYKEIFVDGSYHFNCSAHIPIIFDCGANIGLSSLYFKKIFPRAIITAFEADPQIAEILDENLKNNDLHDVKIIKKAVWHEKGEIEFSTEGADGGSAFVEGNKIKVGAVKLKDLLETAGQIDFLKMDIEGAEVPVMMDCARSLLQVKNIFIEYHAYIGRPQELDIILKILSDAGFRYFLRAEQDKKSPFVNRYFKNNKMMDLQTNIFAYRD